MPVSFGVFGFTLLRQLHRLDRTLVSTILMYVLLRQVVHLYMYCMYSYHTACINSRSLMHRLRLIDYGEETHPGTHDVHVLNP